MYRRAKAREGGKSCEETGTALTALAAPGACGASRAPNALMSHLAEIVSAAGWKRPTSATTHQGNFMRGIILLALFILLAGCAGNTESTSPGAEPAQDTQGQQGSGGTFNIQSCLSECDGLSGSIMNICQSSCYQDKAIAEKDANTCKKVFELMNSTTAYEVCLEEVAIILEDASPCADLDSEFNRDLCYVTVADALGDITICDKVSDDDVKLTKQDCINKVG